MSDVRLLFSFFSGAKRGLPAGSSLEPSPGSNFLLSIKRERKAKIKKK